MTDRNNTHSIAIMFILPRRPSSAVPMHPAASKKNLCGASGAASRDVTHTPTNARLLGERIASTTAAADRMARAGYIGRRYHAYACVVAVYTALTTRICSRSTRERG